MNCSKSPKIKKLERYTKNNKKIIWRLTPLLIVLCITLLSTVSCKDRGDSAFIKGKETYLLGDYDKAPQILGASILHLNEEIKTLRERKTKESKITQKTDTLIEAFLYRGMSYKKMERWGDAVKDFTVVIKMSPEYAKAYGERAICFYQLGFARRSLEDLGIAIKKEFDNPTFLYNRANINLNMKNYQEAIEDISKSILIDSSSANPYCLRAEAYMAVKDYENAVDDYKKAIKLFSNNKYLYESYLSLGKCYYYMSKKKEAEESYKNAFLYNKKPSLAYLNLSILYGEDARPNSSEMEKAMEYAIKSVELSDFKDDKPLVYLASLYFKIENYEKAYEVQKLASEANPSSEEISEWLDIYDNKRKIHE